MKVVAKLAKLSPPPPTTQDRRNQVGGGSKGRYVTPSQFFGRSVNLERTKQMEQILNFQVPFYYTANVYRHTTDKLMFISVISTVR